MEPNEKSEPHPEAIRPEADPSESEYVDRDSLAGSNLQVLYGPFVFRDSSNVNSSDVKDFSSKGASQPSFWRAVLSIFSPRRRP